ncbi:MAG: hypothetical protein ACI82H_000602 [Alphaproteobacteria bacterium]|jgi:hypothetical protein
MIGPRAIGRGVSTAMKPFLVIGICLTFLGAAPDVRAQGNWLDKGSDLLNNLGVGGAKPGALSPGALSDLDISKGLIEALKLGTERVVSTLGQADGFNKSPDIHIPLPPTLAKVQKALSAVGMGSLAGDLELRLNRAAESATPRAKTLFINAISQMTMDDVRKIFNGPKDAATQYFRGKMSSPLIKEMAPVVNDELGKVGAIQTYDKMMGQYRSLPFVPDAKADLTNYVLGKAVDGIFLYLGREEAAIRSNPAKRTTEILQKVFR